MALTEQRRQQLDGLVMRMTNAQAPDEEIRAVVEDYKRLYSGEQDQAPEAAVEPQGRAPGFVERQASKWLPRTTRRATGQAGDADEPYLYRALAKAPAGLAMDVMSLPDRLAGAARSSLPFQPKQSVTDPETSIFRPEREAITEAGYERGGVPGYLMRQGGMALDMIGPGAIAGGTKRAVTTAGRVAPNAANRILMRAWKPRPTSRMAKAVEPGVKNLKEARKQYKPLVENHLIGRNIDQTVEKIRVFNDKLEDQVQAVLTRGQNADKTVRLRPIYSDVLESIRKDKMFDGIEDEAIKQIPVIRRTVNKVLAERGYKGGIVRDQASQYFGGAPGAVEKVRGVDNIDVATANEIKRRLKGLGDAFKKSPDPAGQTSVRGKVASKTYLELRDRIAEAVPEIAPLNKKMGELIPIGEELFYLGQKHNIGNVSLKDLGAGGIGGMVALGRAMQSGGDAGTLALAGLGAAAGVGVSRAAKSPMVARTLAAGGRGAARLGEAMPSGTAVTAALNPELLAAKAIASKTVGGKTATGAGALGALTAGAKAQSKKRNAKQELEDRIMREQEDRDRKRKKEKK